MTTLAARTTAARARVDALRLLMFGDLDETRGGFGWWHGHLEQPKVIFASDYLLQVTGQVGSWLAHAAQLEKDFGENWYAETTMLRADERDQVEPFSRQTPHDERRGLRIDSELAGFFFACGGALDALAAVTIGVLNLKKDLPTASWSDVVRAHEGTSGERDRLLVPPGPERAAQEAAVARIVSASAAGPHGWLRWTLDMRHTFVHRAHRFTFRQFFRTDRRSELQYILRLPKDPQLTDAEAFVLGAGADDLLLREHAGTTLAGVLDGLMALVVCAMDVLEPTWVDRRDAGTSRQVVEQWAKVYPQRRDLAGFAGFDPGAQAPMDGQMRVHPQQAGRLRAARLLDDDRPYWWNALT
ncbi:hypothetical protein AB0M43_36645 [Longispora sp. NPDC051575]|uniref:hypothetical protein n=1 Tax=Longispora sp. NPDC051575 TaxID=3154943 RepID=UPI00341DFD9B